jgi:hypothetical protein
VVPRDILTCMESLHIYEKAAAMKVVKFVKRHFLEEEEIRILWDAELLYERKKYQARHDFPHQPSIRKADISEAKKEKYTRLKATLNQEVYRVYRLHRQRQRKKYPSKY